MICNTGASNSRWTANRFRNGIAPCSSSTNHRCRTMPGRSTPQSCDQPRRDQHNGQDDRVGNQPCKDGIGATRRRAWHGGRQHGRHEDHTQDQRKHAPRHGSGSAHRDDEGNDQADAEEVGQLRKHKIGQSSISLAKCVPGRGLNETSARQSTCAYLALSPAKMSFLWVPPGTNSVPTTTVMTAITIAYHRPE